MTRILIITRNLPPLVGGMERLNWHMADELSTYSKVIIIAPKGSAALKPPNVEIAEVPLKPLPLFVLIALFKTIWWTLRFKPHVVLAGSGLTAPLAWLASKLSGATSAAYLHGLDIAVSNKTYQTLWVPFFRRIDRIIVNSTPTKQLALEAGVVEQNITIIYPGVELPEAPQTLESIQAFKQKHGLEGKKVLLSVGRLTTRKGLREFVEQALPQIIINVPNTVLVVIGAAPKDSLSTETQNIESIRQIARIKGIEDNIRFLGKVDEEDLVRALQSADVHIFPIRHIEGDPEGFGMVAIEAAAHGLPTVAFATGGVVDAVSNQQSGYLVESSDYGMLAQKISQVIQSDKKIWQESCKEFAQDFAWRKFGQKVVTALR